MSMEEIFRNGERETRGEDLDLRNDAAAIGVCIPLFQYLREARLPIYMLSNFINFNSAY